MLDEKDISMSQQPKLPSLKKYPLFLKFTLLFLILRFFNTKLIGIFSLLIALYFLSPHIGLSNPFTALQLLDWLINLSSDYKIAVISSLLTIIGFLIAFQAATLNWKKQLLAETKAKAAEDLWQFYKHINKLITKADFFAEDIIEVFQLIEKNEDEEKIIFKISYIYSHYDEFLKVRQEISELSSEIFVYRDKHYLVTSGTLGGQKKIDKANEAFLEVAKRIWADLAPPPNNDNTAIDYFIRFTKKEEFQELHSACENSKLFIDFNVGYVKGYLMSQIIEPNVFSIITSIKDFKKFHDEIGGKK